MQTKINYILKGKGDTIVLLHGWGGSAKSLQSLQKLLAAKYQVLNIDLPGFGQSPEPQKVIGITEYADLIVDLIKQLKIAKFHLFGHSFGGQIAAQLALKYPTAVKSLILCSAAVIRKRSWKAKIIIHLAKLLKHQKLSLLLNSAKRNLDYAKASPRMKLVMQTVLEQDLTEKVTAIKLPTLILWGKLDQITPLWQAKLIHQQITGSKLKIYPDAKHGLPLKEPQLVATEMEEFLNGLK